MIYFLLSLATIPTGIAYELYCRAREHGMHAKPRRPIWMILPRPSGRHTARYVRSHPELSGAVQAGA